MEINLIEILKKSFTPEIISKLSGLLGENSTNTMSAVDKTLPSILGGLIKKTSTDSGAADVLKLLKDGEYDGSMLTDLGTSLTDKDNFYGIINRSSNTLSSVFGDDLKHVTSTLSKESGVSSNSVSSILGFLSAVVMSLIGKNVISKNLNSGSLTGLLSDHKNLIAGLIPAGLAGVLDIAGLKKITSNVSDYKEKLEEESKSSGKWLWWLLGIIGLLLLVWWWRGCGNTTDKVTEKIDSVKTQVTKKVDEFISAPKTGDDLMDSLYASLGKFKMKKLADGTEIIIAESGVENNLIAFIEDDSKVADKETWFSFDRILFETDKSALRPSSELQLANIAAIMKAYPNVEIKIGGYTDNTGNAGNNLKLSGQRANSVMAELVRLGVPAERMKAEGYGDQFPVASNDTPEGRQKNRRVDVRVSKK